MRRNASPDQLVALIAETGAIVGAQYFADNEVSGRDIKGNSSVTSGERIYHMPSQNYYEENGALRLKREALQILSNALTHRTARPALRRKGFLRPTQ